MSRPTEPTGRSRDRAAPSGAATGWTHDLWLALGAALVVALGAGTGFLLDGSDGALTGTILGLSVCVLAFTVTTVLWATGAAVRYRDASRRPR